MDCLVRLLITKTLPRVSDGHSRASNRLTILSPCAIKISIDKAMTGAPQMIKVLRGRRWKMDKLINGNDPPRRISPLRSALAAALVSLKAQLRTLCRAPARKLLVSQYSCRTTSSMSRLIQLSLQLKNRLRKVLLGMKWTRLNTLPRLRTIARHSCRLKERQTMWSKRSQMMAVARLVKTSLELTLSRTKISIHLSAQARHFKLPSPSGTTLPIKGWVTLVHAPVSEIIKWEATFTLRIAKICCRWVKRLL